MDGTNERGNAAQMDNTQLTLTEQVPIDATATVDLDGRPPSEVWNYLASSDRFQEELVDAVIDAARGRSPPAPAGHRRRRGPVKGPDDRDAWEQAYVQNQVTEK